MAKLAQIRLAGTIAVTALCAAAANTAAAQDGPLVLNNQLQLGDVVAGQTLNVVDVSGYAYVSNGAYGNTADGGTDGAAMNVQSDQVARGRTAATTTMTLRGETSGPLIGIVQARGNNLAATTEDAETTVSARQEVSGDTYARNDITDTQPHARLTAGAYVAVGSVGNNVSLNGKNAAIEGDIDQTVTGEVRAYNVATVQYAPAATLFTSQATANAVQTAAGGVSNQNMTVRQRSNGTIVEAGVNPNTGNAWDLAGRASATGNLVSLQNEGGTVIASTDQDNSAHIRGAARVVAYDFGKVVTSARAAANEVSIVNDDFGGAIDNTQRNSGFVESTATFQGNKGYDTYVGADAVGNMFNCVECRGTANNTQTNNGNVSANTSTTITNSGRIVISGANAVGNSASFYVTGNSGGGGGN